MWQSPRATMQRRLKRQLSNSCSSLHPLPSLSTIMANSTRKGALGRPPSLKRGAKTDSSTLWVTSRRNTLCQVAGSSSMEALRSDRWLDRSLNMFICGGRVFLNIPEDTAFAPFCLNKNTVILSIRATFRSGLNLVLNNNGIPGLMAVKSVSDTIFNRTKGVVAAVYRMDALIGNTLDAELNVLDICIHDETSESELLYANFEKGETEDFLKNSINKHIKAADRLWDIHFIPKPKYLSFPHAFESCVVLALGLISTLLLTYTIKKRDGYNDRLEARVRLRTAELEASNSLKENLLREIHHRVKNNLQNTSSLMNMQKRKLNSQEAITALEDSQARIMAIALTHQKIYQDKDSKAVNLSEYLNDLMEHTKKISSSFSYKIDCPDISIDLDRAVPLALIISELATNAVKHAYPDATKYNELLVNVERSNNEEVFLTMLDNGQGLPDDFDIENAEGIGFEIIRALCRQISAKLTYESNGKGTQFNLVFKNEV